MLVQAILAALIGTVLLASAASKLLDRTGTAVAAESFGLRGRAARWIWLPLAALEAGLAAGVLAGATAAAWAAAATFVAFAAAQSIAIAAGRSGAPCGCFGARGRISWGSVARAALLGAAAALLGGLETDTAGATAANVVVALAAIGVAGVIVLRTRRPEGALDIAGEGPLLGTSLHLGEGVRLALFTSAGCHLCRSLAPRAERLGARIIDEAAGAALWSAANVPGAPFAVALAADGTVLAKGTVNTRAQLASVAGAAQVRAGAEHPQRSSRRGFLQAASAAVAVLTAGRFVGSLVAPGDAQAHHFCGHIFTTDGCPHPTGLPRIDRHGYALRAKDGKPVDDLGRVVDRAGAPIDEAGAPLLDPDGRPMPPARRRRICTAAGKRYRIEVRTDGAWYRCCDGRVRKLIDCCTTSQRRINGDRGLRGYCYARRRVFCVMYFQTNVPC